jgi:predicted transcriptional regulator
MARITIELPDEVATNLRSLAAAGGVTEGSVVAALVRDAGLLSPEHAASLAAGLADADAGRLVPHDAVAEWLRAWGGSDEPRTPPLP